MTFNSPGFQQFWGFDHMSKTNSVEVGYYLCPKKSLYNI